MSAAEHGQDAELLTACAAMDALSAEFNANPRDHVPGSPEEDARLADDMRIKEEMRAVLDRIERAPCTTLDSARLLARTLLREAPDTLRDLDGIGVNDGLQRALIVKLLGDAAEPGANLPEVVATPARAMSVLDIGHHLREAADRRSTWDTLAITAPKDTPERAAAQVALDLALDEVLGWRRLVFSRPPVTLPDAATQLAVLYDHVAELDTSTLEGQPDADDLVADLKTTVRVVAGLAVTVARIAGLDVRSVVDDSLPNRLTAPALGGRAVVA